MVDVGGGGGTLADAAKMAGIEARRPKSPKNLEYLLEWYLDIRRGMATSMGREPLSHKEILAYRDLHDLSPIRLGFTSADLLVLAKRFEMNPPSTIASFVDTLALVLEEGSPLQPMESWDVMALRLIDSKWFEVMNASEPPREEKPAAASTRHPPRVGPR